ncbi:MAG: 30S ribosomal protein S10 [Promethearchaeota archaeon]
MSSTQLDALKSVCEQVEHVCKLEGIRKAGPIPLPTKRLRLAVMKAPSGQGTDTWAKNLTHFGEICTLK